MTQEKNAPFFWSDLHNCIFCTHCSFCFVYKSTARQLYFLKTKRISFNNLSQFPHINMIIKCSKCTHIMCITSSAQGALWLHRAVLEKMPPWVNGSSKCNICHSLKKVRPLPSHRLQVFFSMHSRKFRLPCHCIPGKLMKCYLCLLLWGGGRGKIAIHPGGVILFWNSPYNSRCRYLPGLGVLRSENCLQQFWHRQKLDSASSE